MPPMASVKFDVVGVHDSVTNHWRFSEGSGTTVGDSIGSADASFNALMWNSGVGLDAYTGETDGSDDYGTADASSDANTTWSLWVWFNAQDASNERGLFTETGSSGGANTVIDVGVAGSGQLRWRNNPDGDSVSTSISENTYYFAGLSVDETASTEATAYLGAASDSSLTEVGSFNHSISYTDVFFEIGATAGPGRYWDGEIDDLAYAAGDALSQSEFQNRFDDTKGNYP